LNPDDFKEKVKAHLGEDIKFDGHVDLVIISIGEEKQQNILKWTQECKEGMQIAHPCKRFSNLLSFIYKSNDNNIRGILTKEKNSYFIELFLDKHKYYDRKRRYLGL